MPTSLRPQSSVGCYFQGSLATFIITTIRSQSEPTGFTNPQLRIEALDGTIIMENTLMFRAAEGYYFLDWEVPDDLTPTQYLAIFSSDLDSQVFEKTQIINIMANDPNLIRSQQILNANKENELIVGLYMMIKASMEIPVWDEQALISNNGLKACFTFKRWNIFYNKTTIYRNGEIMNTGYTIDYDNGEVTFDSALTENDTIHADYNFQWFSPEEVSWFLHLAVQEINVQPPGSSFQLGNAPANWAPGIIYGASINALRRLIHDLSYQQPQVVYGIHPAQYGEGGGGAANALENFKYLKENYEKIFEEIKKDIKWQQWPTIGMIIAPEFTMPGGRSRWFRYLFKG